MLESMAAEKYQIPNLGYLWKGIYASIELCKWNWCLNHASFLLFYYSYEHCCILQSFLIWVGSVHEQRNELGWLCLWHMLCHFWRNSITFVIPFGLGFSEDCWWKWGFTWWNWNYQSFRKVANGLSSTPLLVEEIAGLSRIQCQWLLLSQQTVANWNRCQLCHLLHHTGSIQIRLRNKL